MESNLNAIGIILAPIFAIAVSLIWGTTPDNKRFLKAVLIPVLVIILIAVLLMFLPSDLHLSFALQLFLPIVCLIPILLFVEKKIIRYSAIFILSVLSLSLSMQYEYMTRSGKYSLDRARKVIALENLQRQGINLMLYAIASHDSNSYPEGWLSESPLIANLPQNRQENIKKHRIFIFDRPETYSLWHSSFTHIYGTRKNIWNRGIPAANFRETLLIRYR